MIEMLALALVAVAAGCIDAVAGGGGLITIPALLFTGLSPAAALATNKLQGSAGAIVATWHFWRSGEIGFRKVGVTFICVLLGGVLGGITVSLINPAFLQKAIPVALIAVALYVLFSPRISDEDSHSRFTLRLYSMTIAPLIGFYDGFMGPGTGSFFAISLVSLLGWNLRKATAHAKFLNFGSNISALLVMVAGGHVQWTLGLVMIVGQIVGSTLGAKLVINGGVRFVRPVLVVSCFVMSGVLIWKYWISHV